MLMLEKCSLALVEQQVHQGGQVDSREHQAANIKHLVKSLDSPAF